MYARYIFVQYVAICHYRPFVYVSGVPDWVKPCHRVIEGKTRQKFNKTT